METSEHIPPGKFGVMELNPSTGQALTVEFRIFDAMDGAVAFIQTEALTNENCEWWVLDSNKNRIEAYRFGKRLEIGKPSIQASKSETDGLDKGYFFLLLLASITLVVGLVIWIFFLLN